MALDPCWICKLFGFGKDPPVSRCQPSWWKQINSSKHLQNNKALYLQKNKQRKGKEKCITQNLKATTVAPNFIVNNKSPNYVNLTGIVG